MQKRVLSVWATMLLSAAIFATVISYVLIIKPNADTPSAIAVTFKSGVDESSEDLIEAPPAKEFYGSSEPIKKDIERGAALPENTFQRYGWYFTYWKTVSGIVYDDPNTPSINEDTATAGTRFNDKDTTETIMRTEITLVAQWERINYNVVFVAYADEHNNSTDRINVDNTQSDLTENTNYATLEYGSNLAQYPPTDIPASFDANYVFDGWYLTQDDASARATDKQLYTLEHIYDYEASAEIFKSTAQNSLRLYARWDKKIYTLEFDQNKPEKATSSAGQYMPPMEVKRTETPTMMPNTYTVTGWHFMGWNTADSRSDGIFYGSVSFANGATLTANMANAGATVTLYAMWERNRYTISFDLNGGTGTAADITNVVYDSTTKSVLRDGTNITKEGHWFNGWVTEDLKRIDDDYEADDSLNLSAVNNGTAILKASWVKKKYNITLDVGLGNEVEETADSQTGIKTITDTEGNEVTIKMTEMKNAPYGRSFDNEEGTYTPVRAGHTFLGWYILKSPNVYGAGFSELQDLTLTNRLQGFVTEENLKLLYEAGYEIDEFGLIKKPVEMFAHFENMTTLQSIIDFDKYIGDGNEETLVTGSRTSAEGTVNVTLFARWYRHTYTVTYSANADLQYYDTSKEPYAVTERTLRIGYDYTDEGHPGYRLDVPFRDGDNADNPDFLFTGWFIRPDPIYPLSEEGRQITDASGYPLPDDPNVWWIQKDITLYAHFVVRKDVGVLTIMNYENVGHGEQRWPAVYTKGEEFSFSFTAPSKVGFQFDGFLYADGTAVTFSLAYGKYIIDAAHTADATLKIYAKWLPVSV
jgi:hypothetical protein